MSTITYNLLKLHGTLNCRCTAFLYFSMKIQLKTMCRQDDLRRLSRIKPPPRSYCDICEVFDLHDTTDCPKQAMEEDNDGKYYKERRKERPPPRPYCESCEGLRSCVLSRDATANVFFSAVSYVSFVAFFVIFLLKDL